MYKVLKDIVGQVNHFSGLLQINRTNHKPRDRLSINNTITLSIHFFVRCRRTCRHHGMYHNVMGNFGIVRSANRATYARVRGSLYRDCCLSSNFRSFLNATKVNTPCHLVHMWSPFCCHIRMTDMRSLAVCL